MFYPKRGKNLLKGVGEGGGGKSGEWLLFVK
nr:MAG TPA: hypothetical protein [Caudoviricetes sp.]